MQTPAGKPRRSKVPAWLLSPPSSRSEFPATASGSAAAAAAASDADHAVSEYPCVSLFEWWLVSVEGDEGKIAVAGTFERNHRVQEFPPAPIAKRHECCVLETEDGIVLLIDGSLNIPRMCDNGFSIEVCEKFLTGFPHWWQSCSLLYPKVTSSHTGCQPSSSDTNNSKVDSTKFYLESYQLGKSLHSHGSSLISELLNRVQKFSSNLLNGAPRFEEYTCDGGSTTNENSAASNDDTQIHQALCNEVEDNVEVDLTAGRTLRERGHGDIDTNTSSTLALDCAIDAANKEADNALTTSTCNQSTPVGAANEDMPTSVCLDAQNSSYLSNGIRRLEEYTCIDGIPTNGKRAASNNGSERYAAVSNEVGSMEIEFVAGSTLKESGHGVIDTNVSLAFTKDCANDVGNGESINAPPASTCGQIPPLASLKTQDCQKKGQLVALSKKAAADEETQTSVYLDVQNSSYLSNGTPTFEENTCNGDIPTNKDAAASNGDSERYAVLSKEVNNVEIGNIVGSPLRDRDDIATNVSLAPTVECSTGLANEVLYNTPPIVWKKNPVASLKSQGRRRIASDEKPAVPAKKQRSACEKLLGATRSQVTRSPSPYGHWAPLTRGKSTSISMSTPEDLKLRKTRSGRVVVPTLDPGSQRIVYDMDGSISGVIGLDSPITTNAQRERVKK